MIFAVRTLIFLLLISIGQYVYGQSNEFYFEELSLDAGLSQNTVNCILQDSKGYLWIGTSNGLNRYDGYSIKIFKRKFNNENCLSNNDIRSMAESKDGKIWIGTNGGLNVFDPDSGIFRQFVSSDSNSNTLSNNNVRALCTDEFGNIWVGTAWGGLNMLEVHTGRFTSFRHDPKDPMSLSANNVTAVGTDARGNIWVGTVGSGLNRLDIKNSTFTSFRHDSKNPASLSSDFIHSVFVDAQNNMWIGTDNGLTKFDIDRNEFHRFTYASSAEKQPVFTVLNTQDEFLWIGTSEGLFKFSTKTGRYEERFLYGSGQLSNQMVSSLLYDRSGIVWVGTPRNGILKMTQRNFLSYRYDPVKFPDFTNNNIWAFAENPDGKIWVGSDETLFLFDPTKDTFKPQFQPIIRSVNINEGYINSICLDENSIWMGTPNGLLEIDRVTGRHLLYRSDIKDSTSLSYNSVLCIRRDADGNLWVGTSMGLNRLDKVTRKFHRYENWPPRRPEVISNNTILSLYVDRNGTLWIGTMNGLNRYDPAQDTFQIFKHHPSDPQSLSAPSILSMGEDAAGNLWVGTGSGLNVMDKTTGRFKHIGEENGLPDDVIYGIVRDEEGNLWVSSNKGLSKITKDDLEKIIKSGVSLESKLSIRNYDERDGLQGNEFNSGAFLKTKTGEMYFGGLRGFSRFQPSRIKNNSHAPNVLITSVKKFEKEIAFNPSTASILELSHDENMLSFDFVALDYVAPAKNRYAYKLDGVDHKWNYSTTRRYAAYSNLNPGNYVFRVKGSNNDLVWSNDVILNVVIHPPFWRTWWFYTLSFIVIGLGAAVSYKYRVRKHIQATLEIEKVRRMENERVRKKASDDFHDEFGHTLTKIAMLAEILKKELPETSSESRLTLQKIIETSKRLSTGMRDFLWALNPAKDTFSEVAIRIKDFGDELFDRSGTAFFVDEIPRSFESIHLSMQVRRHVILIFKEAMHNILKHSGSKKTVLAYKLERNTITIRLCDNGKGLEYNGDTQGVGLRSMHRRANEIKGRLDICSVKNEGTTVTFTLDLSQNMNGANNE
jgi:ligand-binding sensor domain-containing protein/signal transduction histidine kinase